MALYRRQPEEAERILLQASPPLIHRAIKMNLNLYRWNRALELATKYKVHIDTVLGYRQKYLQEFNKTENLSRFNAQNQVKIDWNIIEKNEMSELEEESQRGDSKSNRRK